MSSNIGGFYFSSAHYLFSEEIKKITHMSDGCISVGFEMLLQTVIGSLGLGTTR